MPKPPLSGLIAAPFTPFHVDGALNLPMLDRLAVSLAANGVSGAFVCGTTGEGASLTSAERQAVAARWAKAKPGELKLVVHVGHNAQAESIALARHAARIKADAIATLAPAFFKPASLAGLVEWCAGVAAAAPRTPFYYYHMPAMTGFHCSVADFLVLAEARIPNLAGVKFTHEDLLDFGLSRQACGGKFDLLHGRDETLLCGLSLGATGAVGSTYNYAARLYLDVTAAFGRGDLAAARAAQFRAQRFIATLVRHGGGVVGGKAIMKMCGLDCGPVRAPLEALAPDAARALTQQLRTQGFFDFAAQVT